MSEKKTEQKRISDRKAMKAITIRIDYELWTNFKIECLRRRISSTEKVDQILRKYVAKASKEDVTPKDWPK